jgi:hypothetical protein
MSKNSLKIRLTEDENLQLQLEGELNRSYREFLRFFLLKRVRVVISAPIKFWQL